MALRLFNTLSRSKENFEPLAPPRVTFYMCGPTVWNYAHIGNFRTFLFGDLLHRYLEYKGFEVFMVMNLTDVDDRTIKAAHAESKTLDAHTDQFVKAFFDDRDFLRIRPADVYPRATRYIAPMVALIERRSAGQQLRCIVHAVEVEVLGTVEDPVAVGVGVPGVGQ